MKKETKIAIIIIVVIAIAVAGYFFYRKATNPFGTTDTSSSAVPVDPKVEYPSVKDLDGFDQGDVLTYKGKSFRANVDAGTWDLIS